MGLRILLLCAEQIGLEMAAAGIRYAELSQALRAGGAAPSCAAPIGSRATAASGELHVYDPQTPATLKEALRGVDVVFAPPLAPRLAAALVRGGRPWVVDLINPEPFEGLEHHRGRHPLARRALAIVRIDRISYALRRGRAFVCATERQRDMWLGMLAAVRRLDPGRYDADPMLTDLIDVVPSGIDGRAPVAPSRPVLRGGELPADARIVLWNGGVWDWFDPETAIAAVTRLHARDDRWRLFFMSTARPSLRAAMGAAERVAQAAGDVVRVNREWVSYADRAGYLLEADVCVSTHRPTLESRFAYRNRLLDCIWAGLPIVCTEGDDFAKLVAEQGWGRTVRPEDPEELVAALQDVVQAGRPAVAESMMRYRTEHTWSAAASRIHELATAALRGARPARLDPVAGLARARHTAAAAIRRPR